MTILLQKNISPPMTRRRDILHYFLSFFTNKDAPTTRITAPILMSNAYGSTVCEINLSSTLRCTHPGKDTATNVKDDW